MVAGDFLFFFFNEGEIIAFLHGFLLKLKKLALFFLVWMCFHWKKIFFFLSRLIHFPLLNPPFIFWWNTAWQTIFDQRSLSQPCSLSQLSTMSWLHPLLYASPECWEQFKVRWEWVSFPQMFSVFLFVMRAPGIAVKLWFCFWCGTVKGETTRVAFAALICEHTNASISVGGLYQLSCVMMLESGINSTGSLF